jgi:Tol biopolymer transport system component
MKRTTVIAVAFLSVLILVAKGFSSPAVADEKEKTAIVAEMIGEGVVSTPDDEFGGTLAPDGKTLYFDKTVPAHYLYVLCESNLVNGKWSKPEVLPFSGLYRDSDPVLSPDGETMFFASDRPVMPKAADERRFQIWQVKKMNRGWSEPTLVPGAINTEGSQVFASVTNDGTMYFTSSRKTGNYDIFRSRLIDGKYQEPEDLGANINGAGIASLEAWIAPDESYLLIGSFGREGGYGNSDLFVSFNENGTWRKPINLGTIVNTSAREYSPRVSADGEWLYFASEKGMPYDRMEQPLTYQQFEDDMKSIRNGLGNIYRVPWAPILKAARAQDHSGDPK